MITVAISTTYPQFKKCRYFKFWFWEELQWLSTVVYYKNTWNSQKYYKIRIFFFIFNLESEWPETLLFLLYALAVIDRISLKYKRILTECFEFRS